MANEEIKSEETSAAFKTEEKQQAALAPMEESLNTLAKSGGYDFFRSHCGWC